MKLPRWLLWSMLSLSLVAALVTAAWWWVTWPERTVRRFLAQQAGGTIESVVTSRKTLGNWLMRQADVVVKTRYAAVVYKQVYEVDRNRIRSVETWIQDGNSPEGYQRGFASGLWINVD